MAEKTQDLDPRIHADHAHLRRLSGPARALSLLPRQPVRSLLNGRHSSRLRGRGLNFEELRNYQIGDDTRTIDWKVTARTGTPYVRVYTEERDRPTLLLVDQRMSMFYGSQHNMKSVTAAEAATLAAFRIRAQGDRVGGIVFSDEVVAELRPKASEKALNRFVSAIGDANCALRADRIVTQSMPLNQPLEAAARIATTGNLILIFSDFSEADEKTENLVRRMAAHNDVMLFPVTDPTESRLPDDLRIVVSDGQLQADLNLQEGDRAERIGSFTRGRVARSIGWAGKYRIPVLPLTTSRDTVPQLRELLGLKGGAR
ncbi:hypothetical protein shim_22660 [Shimia sp. SK013]|uniref:DUF58 domain-containing protein n=1 Tax=Shimia sp. SK013 TaxID=1389006 RepID=UPI0006B4840A|nr:DUF58 domain-containing protein [Shimia sp. SK013]KPA21559.1 hypothetical protein shim_22660 [Shimia sp. SK013]